MWDCNGGNEQLFSTQNNTIRTVNGNLCLDANGPASGQGNQVIQV